jgi:GR25 family glycosyltransferase involved in LPS biosynthesis
MKQFLLKILFALGFFNNLEASIEDYFKKAECKSENYLNQMKNIDFIYTINLDQRPEKFIHCLNELAPYNIHPYRFSAVNGWELPLEAINMLGIPYQDEMVKNLWGTAYLPERDFEPHHEIMHIKGRTYFCHCLSRGAIGIVLSHLSVLQDAYDSGYETIWVMEEDIEVIRNPHVLSQYIDELNSLTKKRWDILFTDQDTKNHEGEYVPCLSYAIRPNYAPKHPKRFASRVTVNSTFKKIGARYGAYSMIVSRTGMKKLLKFFKSYGIFLPYDMDFYLPDDIVMYTVISDVVSTQPNALSDNGYPGYMKNEKN